MNKISYFLPILLITISFSEQLDELMNQATDYYFQQKHDLAFKYSNQALDLSPFHPYANFYIGEYYGFKGEFKNALEYYDKAIKYHVHDEFSLAYYQRAITKIVLYQDLSYCGDIKILKRIFIKDDEYQYLEEEHPIIFGLCDFIPSSNKGLIRSANFLSQKGFCGYSQLFYNEASKTGTPDQLAEYDKSSCDN